MQVAADVAAMVAGRKADPGTLIDSIPLIPRAKAAHGPKTARRLLRFYALLAAVFVLGIAPILLNAAPRWKAFGLGLLFPGAGFLYAGGFAGPAFALLSAALFVVIMFYWWARGPVLAPPGALVGTALLSAAWIGRGPGISWEEWAIPAAVLAFHGMLAYRRRRAFAGALSRAAIHNKVIGTAAPILRDHPVTVSAEMPKSQIGEFRRMLDLALQPVDSWNGFPMNDTWQDGALRYQVCTMSWNLALGQYTQLPAFHGYLNQAQENLIRKHIDRKTWNYWYWESLWGNLRAQKNPVQTDNIMLSGFLGLSLGLFETASGTSPFAAPGSLTFRWDEKTAFPYSHSALLEEVVKNFKRYDYGWFPCEPHWIYSMCNLVGRTSLALHDARHGTNYIAQVGDVFDKTMREEMTLADGRIRVCTSSLYGFTVPSLSGLFGETWGIRFLTPHAPAQAERLWQILKQDFIHRNASGGLDFKLLPLGWDTRKPADFSKWPELNPLIMTLWAALEMGDDEIVDATRKTMDERYGEGIAASMTWSGRNTIRNMVNSGLPEAWAKGPILAQAEYPQVIVARAVSDGAALSLVLHPGAETGIVALGLGRLAPGRTYRCVQSGTQFKAGPDGRYNLSVVLDGRTEIDVVPVN
jgi:hypothetical protein